MPDNDWREEALLAQRKYRGERLNARLAKIRQLIVDRFGLELDVRGSVEDDDGRRCCEVPA